MSKEHIEGELFKKLEEKKKAKKRKRGPYRKSVLKIELKKNLASEE